MEVPPDPSPPPAGVLRLLDAAANRAREGLRVLEDYSRFVLDDVFLTSELKTLRHDLSAACSRLHPGGWLACRDTIGDVGTDLGTRQEYERPDVAAVVTANARRLQESLRSLEEFGKLVDIDAARVCERARYRAYTLEKALDRTAAAWQRLGTARLYVLIDGCESAMACERLAADLVRAGVHIVQLRDKKLPDGELLERARGVRRATRGGSTLLIVNDRPDLAVLAEADGVHVGQGELSVAEARAIVGPRALVGASTHTLCQARQAVLDGADYLGVGPTFPSMTKAFDQFPGLALVRQVAAEIRLPAFAIGGVDPSNVRQVLEAGLPRVAVANAVAGAADPFAAARAMLASLAAYGPPSGGPFRS
jgi:thiamine-phosphate pyrophosphorylase